MRTLVVGAGATGGYFGARLAQAGRDVTFLVRPARAQRLEAEGLRIQSPHGNLHLTPQLATAGHLEGPYDLVLVAVKAYSLERAIEDLAPGVGPNTLVVPLLNGMAHIAALTTRFGPAVVGGLCRINTTETDQGLVQLNALHELWYGELSGLTTARIQALDQHLQGAGFDAHLTPSITHKLWEKWTLLTTLGAITCLMRGTLGEVARVPGGMDLSLAVFAEVSKVATAAGFAPDPQFAAVTRSWLTDVDSTQSTSMYRDLTQGGPIEAEQIVGDFLAQARLRGVHTPLLAAAWANLSVYQNRRQSSENHVY